MEVQPLDDGESAPDFELPGVTGGEYATVNYKTYTLEDFDASALVVVFTCNHCPTAQAYQDRIKAIQADYDDADVVAINSNNTIEEYAGGNEYYPTDSFEHMSARADVADFNFPYLRDESQEVAKSYGAQCTPHAFVFDEDRELVYQGAIDDDREGEDVSEQYVRDAIDAVLSGEEYPIETISPMGCSTKWRGVE
ncbi:thioredoxin family protein [Halopiger xanaduensis]|uniref:Alkyl hydroperoxide reductase/ Thiol specific antioxidant/ Mal allergen n=1 Tax=Halopiger xanaduensis (strain DSM 18323 / JCM 14033 / SH-6) TaxID=797210 RepID=F8DDQ6_HALXS|nr:thioredoxin family protein [Halopiger xanaduensis]AEH39158.1 alkyl hydroperoxide reductase/ Thiol specific antioxidant/ Mal allergen [Halopiger xanaduensis SH-6]